MCMLFDFVYARIAYIDMFTIHIFAHIDTAGRNFSSVRIVTGCTLMCNGLDS